MSFNRCLSRAETTALLGWASQFSAEIDSAVHTLVLTGLRVGEFLHLKWRDVVTSDYQPRSMLVLRPEWTKTRKGREIPIPLTLRGAYTEYIAKIEGRGRGKPMLHWPLWPGDEENPHSARYLQELISVGGRAACNRRVTPHMLRHTYATGLLRVSNTRVVQIALGHESLRSTQIYTHPAAEEIQTATDRLWGTLIEEDKEP